MFFIVARKRQMTHAKESNDMHPMEVIEKTRTAVVQVDGTLPSPTR